MNKGADILVSILSKYGKHEIGKFSWRGSDSALLWSWSVADEYEHDLLTKLWWVRWFLIDEWQTTVYLADIILAIFAWSAALENAKESSTWVL